MGFPFVMLAPLSSKDKLVYVENIMGSGITAILGHGGQYI